jgi:hypothetical protein
VPILSVILIEAKSKGPPCVNLNRCPIIEAMPTVFEKLNLSDQKEIVILNAPEGLIAEIAGLREVTVHRSLRALSEIHFALAFAMRKKEVDELAVKIVERAKGDAILWFAYPKGTSKKYQCDFNRDNGWDALKSLGWDTVRAVAIDEDWSALRFRRTEYIKAR